MLLAYEKGAELIVAVGTHASMVEFLDKGRAGMASTFLTRLRVGPVLVDAKGVNRLYKVRLRRSDVLPAPRRRAGDHAHRDLDLAAVSALPQGHLVRNRRPFRPDLRVIHARD